MTTYKLIIKNILKTYNNPFLYKSINDNIDGIQKCIFYILLNKEINIKNKFDFFNDSLEHFLIKNKKENEFIEYFYKIQKTYNILNRLVYNYKYKKTKLVVNTDMNLNEIDINDKNVICILDNNSKYLFHIKDLINIINSALTNSCMFFAEPKSIKNPYNNIPFSKSTLYNIYFFIKYKTYYHPILLFKFFYVDFNLTYFKHNNEYLLREYTIQNYVYKSPSNILIFEIKNIIEFFNDYCKNLKLKNRIIIDKDFPKNKLIKIMQPYLLLYFISNYAYFKQNKREALYFFKKKMLIFNNFNPSFGRKRYKFIFKTLNNFEKKICGKIIEFNDTHIKFNNNNNNNNEIFLLDHLKYNEINFIDEYAINNSYNSYNSSNQSEEEKDADEDDEEEDEEDEEDDAYEDDDADDSVS